jgi:O-antigen/teichoic acid export membrane protein
VTVDVPLADRAVRGALWIMAGRLSQVLLWASAIAVLARLLGPETMGAFALAMLAMTAADVLVFNTFAESLVQRSRIEDRHIAAAFLISMALAAGLALLILLGAGPAARLMKAPVMEMVMPWIGIAVLLLALGVVPAALLTRELRQKQLVLTEQASWAVSSALSVALALAGAGVWALVAGELIRAGVRTLLLHRAAGWPLRLRTDRAALEDVWRFGRGMVGIKGVHFADRLLPRLSIGYMMGPAAVGLFALGWQLYEQIVRLLVTPMTSVAMATAARAQQDLPLLRSLVQNAARACSIVAYPVFVGVAAIAPVAIPFLFGEAWTGAVVVSQIIALIGLRSAVSAFNGGVLLGLGRTDLQMRSALISFSVGLVAIPLAAGFGLEAVALAILARSFLLWPVNALNIRRTIGLPLRAQARAGLEAGVAALTMGAVLLWVQTLLPHWSAPVLLGTLVAVGALTYAGVLALLAPRSAAGMARAAGALVRGDRRGARLALGDMLKIGQA